MFYYEEKTFDGRWKPATEPEPPSEKMAEGRTRIIRPNSVREVYECDRHRTLNQLFDLYSQDGKLRAMRREKPPS